MKKSFFVGTALIALLFGCKGEDAAKVDSSKPEVADSAKRSGSSDLILKPSPEQIAKARRVGNKHCPTDGEKLGSMGNPIPVIYKGELVELCCSGCPKEFANDPAKYLAIAQADTASE